MPRKKTTQLTTEIASIVDQYYPLFRGFLSYMPNPSLLLSNIKEGMEVFEQMLLDAQISAMLEIRKASTISRSFNLIPFDNSPEAQKVTDFVWNCLDALPIESIFEQVLTALEYGFSVQEVIWKLQGGYWIPAEVKERSPLRFAFTPDGRLILTSPVENIQILDAPYKFIVTRHAPRCENPYGTSLLLRCYWPWQFKKAGMRFWVTMLEKFGVPTVLALFKDNDPERAKKRAQEIAEALYNIQNDAAVAMSNVEDIRVLESKGQGTDFDAFIALCDAQISKAITGQILLTDIGKLGSYALAKVHLETFNTLVRRDARMVGNALQTLVNWIVKLNFGEQALIPEFRFDYTDIPNWEVIRDAIDRGVPISKRALYNVYSLPEPQGDEDVFVSPLVKAKSIFLRDDFFLPIRRFKKENGRK